MLAVIQGVLIALAVVFVAATLLPLVRLPYWWIRLLDFPRSQIAAGAALVLVLYTAVTVSPAAGLSTTEWTIITLLLSSALFQLSHIFPYTPMAREEVQAAGERARGRRLRLVVSNVLMENREVERWKRVVLAEEPDVIAAVEVDAWWVEQLRSLQVDYPHRVELPQGNTYGMAVYSRLPLRGVKVRQMVEDEVPSVWAKVALPDGPPVQLVILHPRPPRPDVPQGSDFRDAELVLVAREVEDTEEGPVVVAGDLNDVAWSDTTRLFQKLSGLLDPRRGRGLYATYHADYRLLRYPLDHVFHSRDLTLADLRVLGPVGSDHFPILVDLAYEPREAPAQEAPHADAGDEEHAEDLVEHAAEHLREETPEEARERKRKDR